MVQLRVTSEDYLGLTLAWLGNGGLEPFESDEDG